jgi:DNA-binding XRE family transcriptional regulator
MATKYGDCRVDLREYKDLILSALSQLDYIIADDEYSLIAGGAIHNIAVNDAKTLTSVLNTRSLQSVKHIVYITEDEFAVLKIYSRYERQKLLIKQRLTDDGIARIQQAIVLQSCYKLLSSLHITVLQLYKILHGYESPADDIYALLNSCGAGVCQQFIEYPLLDDYATPNRPAYKTKQERNVAIAQMYLKGAGLRQIENAGFGIKRAAILSVLRQAGVYKGAEEGKERHQTGDWRTGGYRKHESTGVKSNKISRAKRSESKKRRRMLYEMRINSALTQQQIADLLGCSKAYYCNVENGLEAPSEIFWSKIGSLFRLDTGGMDDVRKVSNVRRIVNKHTPAEQVDTDDLDDKYGYMSGYTSVDFI